MLTKEQFEKKWHKYGKKGRKFIIRYIENGLDPQEAAVYAGYQGRLLINTHRMLRRSSDLDYFSSVTWHNVKTCH